MKTGRQVSGRQKDRADLSVQFDMHEEVRWFVGKSRLLGYAICGYLGTELS